MPRCKIPVLSLGPGAADNFSYLVNHLQSWSWAFPTVFTAATVRHIFTLSSIQQFYLYFFFKAFSSSPLHSESRPAPWSPEAEPVNMPQNRSDGAMINYYEAVQPELLSCLLIIPYLSHPGIQENLSVRLQTARDGWWKMMKWVEGGDVGSLLPASFRERRYLKGTLHAPSPSPPQYEKWKL